MNEKGEVTTNTTEIGGIIRNFYQQLYASKLSNLEEMEAFLETCQLPRLKQEQIDFLNTTIYYEEIEAVIKNLPKNKSPGPHGVPGESVRPWTFVLGEVFDYCFNFVTGYWSIQIVYFFMFQCW